MAIGKNGTGMDLNDLYYLFRVHDVGTGPTFLINQ